MPFRDTPRCHLSQASLLRAVLLRASLLPGACLRQKWSVWVMMDCSLPKVTKHTTSTATSIFWAEG
jgi:hypothetical protein